MINKTVLFYIIVYILTIVQGVYSLRADTQILVKYKFYCYLKSQDKWYVSGIHQSVKQIYFESNCPKESEIYEGQFYVNSTVDDLYKIEYHSLGSTVSDSYLAIYDSDDSMIAKVAPRPNKVLSSVFSLQKPISRGDHGLYADTNVSEDWYKTTFTPTNWVDVISGSPRSSQVAIQYYRYSFNLKYIDSYAAFTLGVQFYGQMTVYINDQQVFNGKQMNATSIDLITKIILPAEYLKETNIVAIQINNLNIPSTSYINLFISLFYASFDQSCAYTLDLPRNFSSDPPTISSQPLFDFKLNTLFEYSFNNKTSVTFTLGENDYYLFNKYIFYADKSPNNAPCTFIFEGKNEDNEPWTIIEYKEQYSILSTSRTTLLLANRIPYHKIRFTSLNTCGGSKTILKDIFLTTCKQPFSLLTYPTDTITSYRNIPTSRVLPSVNGYSSFSITPSLSEGLTINSNTGAISGTPTVLSPSTLYTITASIPISISTTISISVEDCTSNHVKFIRSYGKFSQPEETVSIYTKDSHSLVWRQLPYSQQIDGHVDYFEMCLPSSIYTIDFSPYNEDAYKSWAVGSSFQVYLSTHISLPLQDPSNLEGYVQIFNERLNLLGSQNFMIDLNTYIYGQSTWSHLHNEVPANWYMPSFDSSTWEIQQLGSSNQSEGIHLYRKYVFKNTIDIYGVLEFYIQYLSGIIIYVNGNEIFRNRIIGELSISSGVSSSYDQLYYRRISVSESLFSVGNNTIAIAFVPDLSHPVIQYSFDIILRPTGHGDVRSIYSYDCVSPQCYLFDNDYTSTYSHTYTNNTPIYIHSSLDEYSYITHYAIFGRFNSKPEARPIRWILEGRQMNDGKEEWILLDTQSHYDWKYENERAVFPIRSSNKKSFNEYRISSIANYYSQTVFISQLELYSSSLSYTYPKFEYSSLSVTSMIYQYIECIRPTTNYYSDFSITPSLSQGLLFNNKTGHITGFPTELVEFTKYTITAKNFIGNTVETSLIIKLEECTDGRDMVILDLYYNNIYRDIEILLKGGKEGKGDTYIHEKTVTNYYSYTYDPNEEKMLHRYYSSCVPIDYYTFTITTENKQAFSSPSGYYITNQKHNLYKSGTLLNTETSKSILFDLSSPLVQNQEWSYNMVDTYTLDFLNREYNIEKWQRTTGGTLKGVYQRVVLLRSYFDLVDIQTHNAIHFSLFATGSVTVYINKVQVYKNNQDNNSNHNHAFTYMLQNKPLKSKNNIIGIILESSQPFSEVYFLLNSIYDYSIDSTYYNSFLFSSSYETKPEYPLSNLFNHNFLEPTQFYDSFPIINILFNEDDILLYNTLYIQAWHEDIHRNLFIYVKENENYDWIPILENYSLDISAGKDEYISVPFGLLLVRYIRIEFQTQGNKESSLTLSQLQFGYRKYDSSLCSSIDNYPIVGEGDSSYKVCGYGYQGYSIRYCDGLYFDNENRDHCILLLPSNIHYPSNTLHLYTYTSFEPFKPSYTNIVEQFSITPNLPKGLLFNITNGEITGIPKQLNTFIEQYTVTAHNSKGIATTTFTLSLQEGFCNSIDIYPTTVINQYTTVPCETGYFGQKIKQCVLNDDVITWAETDEQCTRL
ncbi:hypothetical protein WA158_002408 [Blastocystis sp. Blastoise]